MFLFVVFSPLSFFFLSFLFVFFSLPVRLCDVPCWNKCVVLWQELVSLKAAERLSSLTVVLTPRTDSQAVSPRPETRAGTRPASSHSLYTSATSNSIVSHCNRLIRVLQAHSWGRILWAARRTCIQPAQRAVRLCGESVERVCVSTAVCLFICLRVRTQVSASAVVCVIHGIASWISCLDCDESTLIQPLRLSLETVNHIICFCT